MQPPVSPHRTAAPAEWPRWNRSMRSKPGLGEQSIDDALWMAFFGASLRWTHLFCGAVLVKHFFRGRISLFRFRLQLTNERHPHLEYRLLLLRRQIRPTREVFKLSVGRHIVLGMDGGD